MSREGPELGDEAILASIYEPLVRFAGVIAPWGEDPDDLVHEALARTLEKWALVDIEHPAAYLRRTILNLSHNRRRSIVRQLRVLARLGAPTATVDNYPSEAMALLELSPQSRAVLWLADVEGLSYDEIAVELGLTSAAARQRGSRGRAEVRRRVEAGDFDPCIDMTGAKP